MQRSFRLLESAVCTLELRLTEMLALALWSWRLAKKRDEAETEGEL